MWCSAAATSALGTMACTWPATEPRGGVSGCSSLPTLASALAMEITTLPSSWSQTETAVDAAASHGVATMTGSGAAAMVLSPAVRVRSLSGHSADNRSQTSAARSLARDPSVTSTPTDASRTATALPAGPVPPRIPMCTQAKLPRGSRGREIPDDRLTQRSRAPAVDARADGSAGEERRGAEGAAAQPLQEPAPDLPHQLVLGAAPEGVAQPADRRHDRDRADAAAFGPGPHQRHASCRRRTLHGLAVHLVQLGDELDLDGGD